MKTLEITTTVLALGAGACIDATREAMRPAQTRTTIETAKLLIEHNATDGDTGFQIFSDPAPWKRLDVRGPDGDVVFTAQPRGPLRELGMTELFIETNEPLNEEIPIPDVLAMLPAGSYGFEALGVDGVIQEGRAELTHEIPRGPVITSPPDGAEVSASTELLVAWEPVTETIDGDPVEVTYYQVIVERRDEALQPGFGRTKLDVTIPASRTRLRVPCEVLAADAEYEIEVLALERGGNQTLSAGAFTTR